MVIAGAGTGKTQIIGMRIAQILRETDLNPENILCMTFTEAGVSAMQARLVKLIGSAGYRVKVCTFHAFCNEVINTHPEKFPQVNKNAETLTEIEKIRLILRLIKELEVTSPLRPFGKQDFYIDDIKSLISRLKRDYAHPSDYMSRIDSEINFADKTAKAYKDFIAIRYTSVTDQDFEKLISAFDINEGQLNPITLFLKTKFEEYLSSDFDLKEGKKFRQYIRKEIKALYEKYYNLYNLKKQKDFGTVYARFQEELQKEMKYDFDDMIVYTVDAFKNDEVLLNEYQEKYQYILIDEYQDTNVAQNEAIFLLGSYFPNPNIFVVGDDDQSIYKFQGANTQNIFSFKEKYSDYIKIITLKNNYRSHQTILDAAASLIDHNETRIGKLLKDVDIDKNLKANVDYDLRPIEINEYLTSDQELFELSEKVSELVQNKVPAKEIAILCRYNSDINLAKSFLAKAGIPSSKDAGENIFESTNICQLLHLIKYLVDSNNSESLFFILHSKYFNIKGKDIFKLNLFANQIKVNLAQLFNEPLERFEAIGLEDFDTVKDFIEKLNDWRSRLFNTNAIVFFNELINESGHLNYIMSLENKVDEIGKLSRLYQEIKDLSENNKDYTLINFMEDLAVYAEYDIELIDSQTNIISDKVRISTVHGAKGLEFDYVFILDCSDKKWSNSPDRTKIKNTYIANVEEISIGENEEDRRLFYVALTRARKHVSISYHITSSTGKSAKQQSQFIGEIKPDYLVQNTNNNAERLTLAKEFLLGQTNKLSVSDESKDILIQKINNMKFSITNINSYLKCPRCFFYNTVLKIPHLKTPSLSLGTAVHDALKFIQVELNENGQLPGMDQIQARFEKAMSKEFLNANDYKDCMYKGKMILEKLMENSSEIFKVGSISEKSMGAYSINWEGIPLSGNIDLIEFVSDDKKHVSVMDYKTGNPDNSSDKLSVKGMGDYYKQILFYKLLIDNVPALNWTVDKGIIFFVEPNTKTGEMISKEYVLNDMDYQQLKEIVKDVYNKIINFEFDDIGDKCDNDELHQLNYEY
jgi:DNA helicase-2/ATP-dependent DNA helicase PcrA